MQYSFVAPSVVACVLVVRHAGPRQRGGVPCRPAPRAPHREDFGDRSDAPASHGPVHNLVHVREAHGLPVVTRGAPLAAWAGRQEASRPATVMRSRPDPPGGLSVTGVFSRWAPSRSRPDLSLLRAPHGAAAVQRGGCARRTSGQDPCAFMNDAVDSYVEPAVMGGWCD